jgi:hypothetical protein
MAQEHSWSEYISGERLPRNRRALLVLGAVVFAVVAFAAGAWWNRPQPAPLTGTTGPIVIGTPTSMKLNGLMVTDSARVTKIVRDLNSLQPIPGTGDVISSCPNDDGSHFLLVFLYANGDQWTVDVQRQGCQRVTAGGFWPRIFASSNPQLLKDLDALNASLISA